MLGDVASLDQPASQCRRKLRVDDESHSVGAQNRVIALLRCVLKCRRDVAIFQVRKIREDLLSADSSSQQFKDVLHANPQATDAGSATTLLWIDRDAV